MTRRCRRRQTVLGAAVAAALLASGCKELPVRRVEPALAQSPAEPPPPRGYEPPALPPLPPPAPAPTTPLQAISDREALTPSSPTPMLDAELTRAEAVEQAVTGGATNDAAATPKPDLAEPPVAETPAPRDEAVHPAAAETTAPAATTTEPPPPSAPAQPEPAPAPPEPQQAPPQGPQTPPAEPPADPLAAWREKLDELRLLAHAQSEQPGAPARLWAIRENVLSTLAESPASEGSDPTKSTLWAVVLNALASASAASNDGIESPGATLRAAATALEAEAPLEIADLRLCRKVLGFGNYVPLPKDELTPGATVIVYCEMAGLHYAPDGALHRSRLESRVEIVGEGTETPVWSRSLGKAEDVCRHARHDYYVNYRLTLPDSLKPGPYRLRLVQTDLLTNQQAERSLPFRVD